jgi:hypothetical protein
LEEKLRSLILIKRNNTDGEDEDEEEGEGFYNLIR